MNERLMNEGGKKSSERLLLDMLTAADMNFIVFSTKHRSAGVTILAHVKPPGNERLWVEGFPNIAASLPTGLRLVQTSCCLG
jgi:hypothetical protein